MTSFKSVTRGCHEITDYVLIYQSTGKSDPEYWVECPGEGWRLAQVPLGEETAFSLPTRHA